MSRLIFGVTLLIAVALAGSAAAAPAELAARTETWVEATLGVDIPDRPLTLADTAGCGGTDTALGCDAIAWTDRIEVTPLIWIRLDNAERDRRDRHGAGATVIHELLHGRSPGTERALEEGIAEALAHDLYPAWAKAFGVRYAGAPTVVAMHEVDAVRKASALATGKPWKSRDARLWRRDLWRADAATREQVYAAAWG
jgi:hypothetical protein